MLWGRGAAKLHRKGERFLVCAILLFSAPGASEPGPDRDLLLRREYNQVAASIDTLVRLYGGGRLEQLTDPSWKRVQLPPGFDLILIFWADDEAEIFLNGYRVSETRLTPVEVAIPPLYLKERNLLRAHCWDTDRVESGFMAGLYLRDQSGGLRQVLVTEEGNWWVGGRVAQERYYAHSQPDIPGARVIWGAQLFGEVWLETRFDAALLRRAIRRPPRSSGLNLMDRPMEAHEVVSRLVRLQVRRRELERELGRLRRSSVPVRYEGRLRGLLAFSLGRAGPLAEAKSAETATRLREWAERLPEAQRRLIFRDRRPLKGVEAATPEQVFEGATGGEIDRRTDYVPPREQGPARERGEAGRGDGSPPGRRGRSAQWGLAAIGIGLAAYIGAVFRKWWRLFNEEVWAF